MRSLLLVGVWLWAPGPAVAEVPGQPRGKIVGTVVDEKSNEPMIEAQVTVVGTQTKVLTDVDGRYELSLPPGEYELRVWAELMEARRLKGVRVEAAKTTALDVKLGATDDEAKIAVQEVVVVAAADKATEAVQIVRRQKSAVVTDAVSAEQIARSPDSSASDAVKRVVSATVQDNKYVIVRGLGGRYSATLLNGIALPGVDPDQSSAPLDLFPAVLLANLTVQKTFSPDMPGAFAGGTLLIETRDFPTKLTGRLRLQTSGDDVATFRGGYTYRGGNLDFLGYDDGARALPKGLPKDGPLVARDGLSQQQINDLAKGFRNEWTPARNRLSPNLGLAGSLGDTIDVGQTKVGYLGSFNFGRRATARHTKVQRSNLDASEAIETRAVETQTDASSLGALLSIGVTPSPRHRYGMVAFYTHSAEDSVQLTSFTPEAAPSTSKNERTSLRFVERSLAFTQITGEHQVHGDASLTWQLNGALTGQAEPDTRDLLYLSSQGGPLVVSTSGTGSADRYFASLADRAGGGGLDLTVPLAVAKVKLGGAVQATSRRFSSRRFRFDVEDPTLEALAPDDLFVVENIGNGIDVEEVTRFSDAYRATRNVIAGYALADVARFSPLRVVVGARYELSLQQVNIGSKFAISDSRNEVERNEGAILPAVNLIYELAEGMNARAAYSMTVARPSFRELSPVLFFDFSRNRAVSGNPELITTRIQNFDLRLERFFGPTELVAASVFAKLFHDPIESTFKDQGGDTLTYVNTPGARAVGLEIEGKTSLARLHDGLSFLFVGANASLIASRISLDKKGDTSTIEGTRRDRPLQGQSPYVVNLELGSRHEASKTEASLMYNVFGARISEVGVGDSPDAYERPFHRLDLTVSQTLLERYRLKLAAQNLLNQRVRFERRDVTLQSFRPGVTIAAAAEMLFD